MKREKLMTQKEAADVWGVTVQRAAQIISELKIPTVRCGAKKRFVRIRTSEVERVRQEREIPTHTKGNQCN